MKLDNPNVDNWDIIVLSTVGVSVAQITWEVQHIDPITAHILYQW
jgi:hypothetical protein